LAIRQHCRKQPIRIFGPKAEKALYGRSLAAGRAAIALRCSADEDAIRTEHCPLGIDHDPSAPRAAQIQPAHGRGDRVQAALQI
jgi:hypothetical protein